MRALIVASVRDEGAFFLEWLAYHQAIGFTDFLIYSNDCADGVDAMLDRLEEMGQLVHKPNPRRGKKAVQWQALNRASRHQLFKKADWAYATDLDEFLLIHAGEGRLADLLAARPDATGFALAWRLFGNAGQTRFVDQPITEQFQRAAPSGMLWPTRAMQFKSLFRADGAYARFGVHMPRDPDPAALAQSRWYDGGGRLMEAPPGPASVMPGFHDQYALAQINHYALGAIENFIVKRARGRAVHQDDEIGLDYWVDRNFVDVEDARLWTRFGAEITDRVAALMEDAALKTLHHRAVAWRRARIQTLMQSTETVRLFARIRQIGPSKVLTEAEQRRLFAQLLRARQAEMAAKTAGGAAQDGEA